MRKTLKLVMKQVKICHDGRFIQTLNPQKKFQKEFVKSRSQFCKRFNYSFRSHKLWRKCLFLQLYHIGLIVSHYLEIT